MMKRIMLAVASVAMLFAIDARAAVIQYSNAFSLRAFSDVAPYTRDNYGGLHLGGYKFQNTADRTSTPSALLSVPKFDDRFGDLQSVSLKLTSVIAPALDYRYDYTSEQWIPNGYFPAQAHDPFSELAFPYPRNDAGVSYRIYAFLNLDSLVPNYLPVVMGLTASASCYKREYAFFSGTDCAANDADGFGVSTFDWNFNVTDQTAFIGLNDLFFRAAVDAEFQGSCDYDDGGDFVGQDTCKVDPSFIWSGSIRVEYTFTDRVPGGDEGGNGDEGGGGSTQVPEPSALAIMGTGLVILLAARRRRLGFAQAATACPDAHPESLFVEASMPTGAKK